jgi:hypothetical protein
VTLDAGARAMARAPASPARAALIASVAAITIDDVGPSVTALSFAGAVSFRA